MFNAIQLEMILTDFVFAIKCSFVFHQISNIDCAQYKYYCDA